jgi:hypothetical protein
MDVITGYLSAHPAVFVIAVILIILMLLNFFFKSLIKLVLIMMFILLVAIGYYYFKDPSTVPEKIKASMETMQSGVNEIENKGKGFYDDSKDFYKKTKDDPESIGNMLEDSKKQVEKDFKKR